MYNKITLPSRERIGVELLPQTDQRTHRIKAYLDTIFTYNYDYIIFGEKESQTEIAMNIVCFYTYVYEHIRHDRNTQNIGLKF